MFVNSDQGHTKHIFDLFLIAIYNTKKYIMEKLMKGKKITILNYEKRVKAGYDIVLREYPDAKLYKVDLKWIDDRFLLDLKFTYTDEKTIYLRETDIEKWDTPVIKNEFFFGIDYFDWPVKMNFEKAFELREKKGFSNEFNEVILMKHWFETPSNPCFFFNGNPSVLVDTVNGEVYPTYRMKK